METKENILKRIQIAETLSEMNEIGMEVQVDIRDELHKLNESFRELLRVGVGTYTK